MIDYKKLSNSIEFYSQHGFEQIEAPWWVSPEVLKITTPKHIKDNQLYYIENNKKCLVASGEQSFLYIAVKGRLPKGKYQTVTPCFRDESIGMMHRKCFMKNELIITDDVTKASLMNVIDLSLEFFATQVSNKDKLSISETEIGYDINYDNIEIGSYGIRSCEFLDWVYATGCAEPRLTHAIAKSLYQEKKGK